MITDEIEDTAEFFNKVAQIYKDFQTSSILEDELRKIISKTKMDYHEDQRKLKW
jgi:hypothetical protein